MQKDQDAKMAQMPQQEAEEEMEEKQETEQEGYQLLPGSAQSDGNQIGIRSES